MENTKNTEIEMQNAREMIKQCSQAAGWAEQRSMTVSDEFIRLEVQIATVLFAFSSLFIDKFDFGHLPNTTEITLFIAKLTFAISLLFLIGSFSWGLLHLKSREKFCDTIIRQRMRRQNKWMEVAKDQTTFKEADAFHSGTSLGDGLAIKESDWSWILQTVSLAIGVTGLFTLALVFLFS